MAIEVITMPFVHNVVWSNEYAHAQVHCQTTGSMSEYAICALQGFVIIYYGYTPSQAHK